jgi:hypothetical protein
MGMVSALSELSVNIGNANPLQAACRHAHGRTIAQMAVQKMHVIVQKSRSPLLTTDLNIKRGAAQIGGAASLRLDDVERK